MCHLVSVNIFFLNSEYPSSSPRKNSFSPPGQWRASASLASREGLNAAQSGFLFSGSVTHFCTSLDPQDNKTNDFKLKIERFTKSDH